jgi:hypothetical protein
MDRIRLTGIFGRAVDATSEKVAASTNARRSRRGAGAMASGKEEIFRVSPPQA